VLSLDILRGTVERLVFRKADSPYTVLRFRTRDQQLVTVVGSFTSIMPGQVLELSGEYTQHAQYGRQFAAKSYEEKVPNDVIGIEKYLGSGLIKGIGPGTARKIVAHFGADTLRILDEAPERLPEVPGIGDAKAKLICASQAEQKQVRGVMVFLQGHGISPGYATRIYRTYGAECEEQIRRNPYQVADNVHGIGFKTADKLARELGIEVNDPRRVAAGIRYLLREAEDQGHCYLPLLTLEEKAEESLQVSKQLVPRVVDALVNGRSLVRVTVGEECRIYRAEIYFAERAVASKLRELSRVQLEIAADSIDFVAFEAVGGLKLAEEQKQAVAVALHHGIAVITGGPGTGKTTLVRALLHVCQERSMTVYLAAPTGRAAKRLSESTGQEAKTLHRLLEFTVAGGAATFARNEESPLKCDMLVLDEASMIDLSLMNSLLKAVPLGCHIVLVGDIDQLPPVGAGNVLRDIISSGLVPAVRLQTIFRQAQQSLIVYNAHRINRGEFPYLATRGRDFQFIQLETAEGILDSVANLVVNDLPKLFRYHPIADIQVLSPMRKTLTGVDNLNLVLQQRLNPAAGSKPEVRLSTRSLRLGDKVMQIRNNYTKLVFNGDIGRISAIDQEDGLVRVLYADLQGHRQVDYELTELDDLSLAYAVSVHKSQGSEYKAVVLPFSTQHYLMLQRNLLYTAITRAREFVVVVGSKKAVAIAVGNNRTEERYTGLTDLMQQGWLQ